MAEDSKGTNYVRLAIGAGIFWPLPPWVLRCSCRAAVWHL